MFLDEQEIQQHLDAELGKKLHMSTLLKDQIPTIQTRGLDGGGRMLVRTINDCDFSVVPFRCVPKTRSRVVLFENLEIDGVVEMEEASMEIAKNLALSTGYEILKEEDHILREILEGWSRITQTHTDAQMHLAIRKQAQIDFLQLIIHGRNRTSRMKPPDTFSSFYTNREFSLASTPDADPWIWVGKVGFEDNILTQVVMPKDPQHQVEVTLYEGTSILRMESLRPAVEVEYLYSEADPKSMIGFKIHITASTGFAVVDPSLGIKISRPPA